MDSVDKLRWWAKRFGPMGSHDPLMFADEIEAEIERNYMRLPVDADGVPIRPGDKMDAGEVFAVSENPGDGAVWFTCNSGFNEGEYRCEAFRGYCHRHVKPRTLEDVLREFASKKIRIHREFKEYSTSADDDVIAKYADEICELLGGDAE